jgi:hypothetical protein
MSLLRVILKGGAHTDDFEKCRVAVTGGLDMPEGQLEVAGIDLTRARRSRTIVEKRTARHHAKAAAIIRDYNRRHDPAVPAARRLKYRIRYQDPEDRAAVQRRVCARRYDPDLRPAYLAQRARAARSHRQRSARARAYARDYHRQYRQRPDRILKERERSRRRRQEKIHTPERRAIDRARGIQYYWEHRAERLQQLVDKRARIKVTCEHL